MAGGFNEIMTSTYIDDAELYDPATGTWAVAQPMNHGRTLQGAALLVDGKVLMAAGDDLMQPTAEIFDPIRGTWTDTPPMQVYRDRPEAVALADGRVLVAGGCTAFSQGGGCVTVLANSEIFDPSLGTWTITANSIRSARLGFGMAALEDGRVVAAGGCSELASNSLLQCVALSRQSDVFDPATGLWSPTADLPYAVDFHRMVRLRDGRVLLAGGLDGRLLAYSMRSALFDPITDTWSVAGRTAHPHKQVDLAALADGGAVFAGSWGTIDGGNNSAHAKIEVFDPVTETWSSGGSMQRGRASMTATELLDGRVLWAGGVGGSPQVDRELGAVEHFDPEAAPGARTP